MARDATDGRGAAAFHRFRSYNCSDSNLIMHAPRLSLVIILLTSSMLSSCHKQSASPSEPRPGGWQLVWADEFDYTDLPNPAKWGYDVGGNGWGNQELQHYTERRRENARVENGRLIIEARREAWEGREYTSARLVTKGKGDWTYGRFEVSAKLPSGRGTWPAVWMLPTYKSYGEGGWPDNGEIDVMEHVGFDPDVVHSSVHTRAYYHSVGTQKTAKVNVPTARTGFNVYAVEWTPEEVRGYVNGQHYFTFKNERLTNPAADYKQWPFDKPFHLILNIAVGGSWGGAEGVDETIWPQRMEVDYVRVYSPSR
jgi:beta-glucanase (GH16 family)